MKFQWGELLEIKHYVTSVTVALYILYALKFVIIYCIILK